MYIKPAAVITYIERKPMRHRGSNRNAPTPVGGSPLPLSMRLGGQRGCGHPHPSHGSMQPPRPTAAAVALEPSIAPSLWRSWPCLRRCALPSVRPAILAAAVHRPPPALTSFEKGSQPKRVVRTAGATLHRVLGVLHRVPGVLHKVLGVLHRETYTTARGLHTLA